MIVLTGAAGFIGSCMLKKLNLEGRKNVVLVDEYSRPAKNKNLVGKDFALKIHRDIFLAFWRNNLLEVEAVIHLGARTDTTEKSTIIFDQLNLNYSKQIWQICSERQIPLIYASSAATYGLGEYGHDDEHDIVSRLQPLNPYGQSKNDFDTWALQQAQQPPFWVGLKFFNVYGPNEYHKERMASVVFHTARQIEATGAMKLFRSHKKGIADGQQSRDFIYVKDVVAVIYFLLAKRDNVPNGLYNLGTGIARTFWDLASQTFAAMDKTTDISFVDTPADIRSTYQYFTEANMRKLRAIGYHKKFYSLEEGILDYVENYLIKDRIW
ncbi:MAG: ADP-glyceromanno-heptose 6-epimerase [Bacteroidota bacterium]